MDDDVVARAAAILRDGGVVAIPTETVYGLAGAIARPEAIARIYAIKGRPHDHPLIVHAGGLSALDGYVGEISDDVRALAEAFWPGPLTMILQRGRKTPLSVTGGQETVAVRVPAHPIARAILSKLDGPIAAPSANRFGRISPTTAQHVRDSLGADVDLIVDGGASEIGVESTILDLSSERPAVLRSGAIAPSHLRAVLGRDVVVRVGGDVRAPGTLASHYAPRARLVLVDSDAYRAEIESRRATGERVGELALSPQPEVAARTLYADLRALDNERFDTIVCAHPPNGEAWDAVRDRLTRAAARP